MTDSLLCYAITHCHTIFNGLHKEWFIVKWNKKDVRTRGDIEEQKAWVWLLDGKGEQEIESLNLMFSEKYRYEFNEIMNGLHNHPSASWHSDNNAFQWTQDPRIMRGETWTLLNGPKGSHRWMVEQSSEMVHQYSGTTRDWK